MSDHTPNDAEFLRGLARAEFYDTNNAKDNEYRDRLTALADRLDGGVIVPRKDYDAILKQAAHYFTPKPDSDRFCAECGEYLTSPMHNRAMLTASEAK